MIKNDNNSLKNNCPQIQISSNSRRFGQQAISHVGEFPEMMHIKPLLQSGECD